MIPAPGMCADGSGPWLPLLDTGGRVRAICPSDPLYPIAVDVHSRATYGSGAEGDWTHAMISHIENAPLAPLGALPVVQICPECSYMTETGCVWCPPAGADNIPECFECDQHHQKKADPWYKNPDFVVPIAATVIATVVSALLLKRLRLG